VEVGENIRETSKGDVDEIEIDLKKIILMIEDQKKCSSYCSITKTRECK
jgi:hypothetical protein